MRADFLKLNNCIFAKRKNTVYIVKTKNQIIAFLSTVRATEEVHGMAIMGYCKSVLGIQVDFNENMEDRDLPDIKLEDFKKWLEEDTFYRGMVIYSPQDSIVGIIGTVSYQTISLCVSLDRAGHLLQEPIILKREDCREAAKIEKLWLQHKLNDMRLGWNRRKLAIFKSDYILKDNQQVRLSLLGEKIGLGVFKQVDESGQLVMYCVKMKNQPARYSKHEVVGPVKDFQIEPISTYERRIFSEELKKCGVSWNGHLKTIDYAQIRVEAGGTYYYLNDLFEVAPCVDEYRLRDTKRWKAGNYFTRKDSAERFRQKLQASIPKM